MGTRLAGRGFWDARNRAARSATVTSVRSQRGPIGRIVDTARLRRGAEPGESYNHYALWRLLRSHLPVCPGWNAIEVGCAPGHNLVDLNRMFGYEPYGVEYSRPGVISTRELFRRHRLSENNVIEADFFSDEFQTEYKGRFNVVFSSGFIEHFDSPAEVLALHMNLLKEGGYLICVVPNLFGLFYPFLWLCGRDLLKAHNLVVMRESTFSRLHEPLGLDVRFCGYVGGVQFYGSSLRHERSPRGLVAGACDRLQDCVDHCMFLLGITRVPQSRLSGCLAFIGRRAVKSDSSGC